MDYKFLCIVLGFFGCLFVHAVNGSGNYWSDDYCTDDNDCDMCCWDNECQDSACGLLVFLWVLFFICLPVCGCVTLVVVTVLIIYCIVKACNDSSSSSGAVIQPPPPQPTVVGVHTTPNVYATQPNYPPPYNPYIVQPTEQQPGVN
ncbi:uncharacterized protein LOC142342285 [Convolutriloba macropyga]|uniref:uncharacterized protein LOC142342285 n=1 Tax=Convolutriloba macropyga TaxID=536237 RepID=UPI003F526FF9